MSMILIIVFLYVGVISLGFLVMLWGKQEGDSIFDKAYRLFGTHLPGMIKGAARCCCGNRGPEAIDRVWNYIVWQNNPIVVIFYLIIICAGYLIFVLQAYPHIPNTYNAWWHKYTGFGVFCWCIYNFAMACMKDPGVITKKNVHKLMKVFPPDNQIFFDDTECSTCNFNKPARSKHCGLCNWCVSKFDHHCIWVNNCIGLNNHYYFLNFLLSNCVICAYGLYLGGCILWDYVIRLRLFDAVFIHPATQERIPATTWIVFQYLMHTHGYIVCVIALCGIMAIVLIGFWGWHLYLVLNGTTSNEISKWSALKRYLKDKYVSDKKKYECALEAYDKQQAAIFDQKPLEEDEEILERPKEPIDYRNTLVNEFHLGWWGNLKLVIWPPSIHSEKWINSITEPYTNATAKKRKISPTPKKDSNESRSGTSSSADDGSYKDDSESKSSKKPKAKARNRKGKKNSE